MTLTSSMSDNQIMSNLLKGLKEQGWQVNQNQLMSMSKMDLINKESPLSNKDLDFLNEIKPDTSIQEKNQI